MAIVSMKQLLESGVHFGHQTRRWDPKMKPYIFTERNGIYILDLQQTLELIEEAYRFVSKVASKKGSILFVGTKKQAQESIKEEAERVGMPYVDYRWLGGTLTNFATIRKRIKRLEQLEQMEKEGTFDALPKKEVLNLKKEQGKLERNLSGIRNMSSLPGAVYIVDIRKEKIALKEAQRLKIPIVAMVDTNCDPNEVDYIIPSNDDAIRAISLITKVIANGALEGKENQIEPEEQAEDSSKIAVEKSN